MRDGHRSECKACHQIKQKAWYEANREHAIAEVKRWQQENKEHLHDDPLLLVRAIASVGDDLLPLADERNLVELARSGAAGLRAGSGFRAPV